MNNSDRNTLLRIFSNMDGIKTLPQQSRIGRINRIMNDLEEVFDVPDDFSDENDFFEIEVLADKCFYGGQECDLRGILESLYDGRPIMNLPPEDTMKRIRTKRIEMAKDPASDIVLGPEDNVDAVKIEDKNCPYGRSPLHHAIAMNNIPEVRKFVLEGIYLDMIDNNGDTPYEMATQMGKQESIIIFRKYGKLE
ncbi:MAG: ankyrin repeat domain-containing protein [Clostridiales bacterium]|nr:ankyrin repeat domain-containing protein [Clostridiales bacterium]